MKTRYRIARALVYGAALLLVAACDNSPQCIEKGETAEVLAVDTKMFSSYSRGGRSDYRVSTMRLKRGDGSVCIFQSYQPKHSEHKAGDILRGPL